MAHLIVKKAGGVRADALTGVIQREILRTAHREGSYLVGEAKQRITEMGRVDRGDLRQSVSYSLNESDPSKLVLKVGSNLDYSVYVHEGTRPHFPPFEPIRDWVYRKFPAIRSKPDQVDLVAVSVQRVIGQRGTKANPFLKQAFDERLPKIRKAFSRALTMAIKKAGGSRA